MRVHGRQVLSLILSRAEKSVAYPGRADPVVWRASSRNAHPSTFLSILPSRARFLSLLASLKNVASSASISGTAVLTQCRGLRAR